MGLYTRTTRAWLDQRFRRRSADGVYFAHMPVYGIGHPDAEGGHTARLARFLRILRALDGLSFHTLLDVGGAEGYLAHVVRTMFGAEVASTDLSLAACQRARELFAVSGAALDSARLPFADGAFDVVVCSEVLEHVENPVETLLELQRVARVAAIVTTEEVRYDRFWLDQYLFKRPGWPHMERNLFHPDDLRDTLPGATLLPQCDTPPPQQPLDAAAATAWILANTSSTSLQPGRIGVCAVIPGREFASRPRTRDDASLLAELLAIHVQPGHVATAPTAAAEAAWLAKLRDPSTGAPLHHGAGALLGSRRYPVVDGVPDFVDVEAPPPEREALLARLAGHAPAHRDALLRLRDRLHLPDRWSQDVFDLTQREARRGFWPNEQLVPRGEGFRWQATGDDPWVVTPCLQRSLRALRLVMRIHAPGVPIDAGTGQVFWKGPDDETFTEAGSVKFPLVNDGQLHTYDIVLAGHPNLPREVQWLRLDLADGPCEIDLERLELQS
ncbi:MAG: class I SAM-dependent methyltransferase [Planctomycetes bacterium]|nr:class I SAM-dependent methyltransferase [Planctomycetota bacterium]